METTQQTFERWLEDGRTWIGVFENHDLGHPDVGRKIALSFDNSQDDQATIGETRAPDHQQIGLGWRYVLTGKYRRADEALAAMGDGDG